LDHHRRRSSCPGWWDGVAELRTQLQAAIDLDPPNPDRQRRVDREVAVEPSRQVGDLPPDGRTP
jgi:hypothetical protein